MEFEISNFISNVMNTMKSQEEVENFDLLTGLPMRKTISITLVRAAFKDTLLECMKAVRSMLDRTPPYFHIISSTYNFRLTLSMLIY